MNVMLMTTMGMKDHAVGNGTTLGLFRAKFFKILGFDFKYHIYGFHFFFPEFSVSLVVDKIDIYSVFLC